MVYLTVKDGMDGCCPVPIVIVVVWGTVVWGAVVWGVVVWGSADIEQYRTSVAASASDPYSLWCMLTVNGALAPLSPSMSLASLLMSSDALAVHAVLVHEAPVI